MRLALDQLDDEAIAYPFHALTDSIVINDIVATLDAVALWQARHDQCSQSEQH
jgi:hypothetical protein